MYLCIVCVRGHMYTHALYLSRVRIIHWGGCIASTRVFCADGLRRLLAIGIAVQAIVSDADVVHILVASAQGLVVRIARAPRPTSIKVAIHFIWQRGLGEILGSYRRFHHGDRIVAEPARPGIAVDRRAWARAE